MLSERIFDKACPEEYDDLMKDTITVSRAQEKDLARIMQLLQQVNHVHASIRPDLFADGERKYTQAELCDILRDADRPVLAAYRDGILIGYAFCIRQKNDGNMVPHTTLYLDALCVDEAERGTGIGHILWDAVKAYARAEGDYEVTLNVWSGNDAAMRFYRSLGLRKQKIGMEYILEEQDKLS